MTYDGVERRVESIVVKEVTIVDIYNDLQKVMEKQDDLCHKIEEYNGLRERLDKIEKNCKFNLYDDEGYLKKMNANILKIEKKIHEADTINIAKGMFGDKLTRNIVFAIALIGGISGLIQLLKTLINILQ